VRCMWANLSLKIFCISQNAPPLFLETEHSES
jgi:hypothetical protein